MTGAVASSVAQAFKGSLRPNGNRPGAKASRAWLRGGKSSRAEADLVILQWNGIAVAQRIKVTIGITGTSSPRVHRREVWHLDVGSSLWSGSRSKGWAVRPLKRYASWVQNVVGFGPYPACAQEI